MSGDGEIIVVRDGRRHGWFAVENRLIDGGYARRIGPGGVAVYLALCRRTNNTGGDTPVRIGWLADVMGMGASTVREKLRLLERYRMVRVEAVVRAGGQRANEYTLLELGRVLEKGQQDRPPESGGGPESGGAPPESGGGPPESGGPFKTTPYLNNFRGKNPLTPKQITKLIFRVRAYLRDNGGTIDAMIAAGELDADEWSAALASKSHRPLTQEMA